MRSISRGITISLSVVLSLAGLGTTGCAATHYGAGLNASYSGDGPRIGVDGHYGVFINGGLLQEDEPPALNNISILFALQTGLDYDLDRGAFSLRYPGPQLEWMGEPDKITYHVLARFNTTQSFDDSEFAYDLGAGGGLTIPLPGGDHSKQVLLVGPRATFSIGGNNPNRFLFGLGITYKRLDWSGLVDLVPRQPPPPSDTTYQAPLDRP